MENIVSYDLAKLKRLIKAYNKCKPKTTFIFEGNEYLKEYAGYLIEHLKNVFKYKDVFEYKERRDEPVDETDSGVPKGG